MRYIFVIVVMLLSSTASAFTEAEKVELQKLIQASMECSSGLKRATNFLLEPRSTADHQRMGSLLSQEANAITRLSFAVRDMFSDITTAGHPPDRAREVLGVWSSVDNALASIDRAKELALPWMDDSQIAASIGDLEDAAELLRSIDRTFAYTDWRPASYPRNVGPHGDYDSSLRTLNGTALYFHRVLATIVRLYTEAPVWPEAANEHIRVSLRKWVDFNRLFLRARGLDAEIVLRTDRAIIEADTDAASGQRPFAFHRVPFTAELIFGNGPNVPLHSGRLPKEGIANQVLGLQVGFTRAFREVARVSTHSQIIEVLLSEDNTDGLAGLFYIDFMEVWSRLDPWAVAVMGFFHKLPA